MRTVVIIGGPVTRLPVLDYGYVSLVESWGSDQRIIEAARMSTDGAFRGWGTVDAPGDERLLRYLWTHQHASPFEMAGMTIEVQAPIFVIREWQRHRTQSYNEMSARYAPLPDLHYLPTVERVTADGGGNKQAGAMAGAQPITREYAEEFVRVLERAYEAGQALYASALEAGVPKELARLALPMGRYTRMRASANLRNWLAFLALRLASDAQWEIRQYAHAVLALVRESFPRTAELFEESQRE